MFVKIKLLRFFQLLKFFLLRTFREFGQFLITFHDVYKPALMNEKKRLQLVNLSLYSRA